ncbi:hypothetical protein B0H14DRAFT_2561876 [Mycena olivaceomarginata]|nr:hypothetical protein B0H14DRAFT_2561876 [Mycena olivaceomarginata]
MSLIEPHVWSIVLPLIASACPNLASVSLTQLDSPTKYHNTPVQTLALAFLVRRALGGTGPRAQARLSDISPSCTRRPTWSNTFSRIHPTFLPFAPSVSSGWPQRSPHLKKLMRILLSIICRLTQGCLTPELSLWIEALSLYEDTAVLHGLGDAELKQLARIERLHLESLITPGDLCPFLKPVVAMFQGLTHVSVETFAIEASILQLVGELQATDALKSIKVNGKSYDLPSY